MRVLAITSGVLIVAETKGDERLLKALLNPGYGRIVIDGRDRTVEAVKVYVDFVEACQE